MTLRIAVVGAGRIADDYLQVLAESTQWQITAIVEPRVEARDRAAAANRGVPTFPDCGAMLDSESTQVDAALVLAPPIEHAPLSTRLLEAGCHVLCEKPLATNVDDAELMLHTADRCGRVLMMASKFRFVEDVTHARELIAQGTIGPVAFYQNSFCAKVDMGAPRWNADPAISGGGVLIDNGTHSVDIARFLIGPLARVTAKFGPRIQPLEVEDSAMLLFESAGNAIGRIELSWSIDRPHDHYIEIHGAHGTLQIGWKGSRYRRDDDGQWVEFGSGYDKRRAFAGQLAHFAKVCEGKADPLLDNKDARASVELVEAAYRAARCSTWESVSQS